MPRALVDEPISVFGKLPARGDFITRRFARPFVNAWDDWLQEAVAESHEALGERWLDLYLTSPVWRFALAAQCCGPEAVFGIMIPSVDSVGRYFPLMLGRAVPDAPNTAQLAPQLSDWYQAVEDLALSALAPGFDLAAFETPLAWPPIEGSAKATVKSEPLPKTGLHIALASRAQLDAATVAGIPPSGSLWWTAGSEAVASCVVACPTLPPPDAFVAFLDGQWTAHGVLDSVPPGDAAL